MRPISKSKSVRNIFVLLILLVFTGCRNIFSAGLENGDLLFVTAKSTGLSGAINNVTQQQENVSFDHIGILEKSGYGTFVLHAAPEEGSQRQELQSFLQDQKKNGQRIIVYRLKPPYRKTIPDAIGKAHSMLGKPYNFNYILDENSYYCSDFIERAFRKDHVFELKPMSFKDPQTGSTNAFWEEFYRKKNLKVPEGEPGCNPNGLAGSEKLERVRELK